MEEENRKWLYNFRIGNWVKSVVLQLQEWKEIIISGVANSGMETEYHQ
jgi:hypothetical protein